MLVNIEKEPVLVVSADGVFSTIQGEGVTQGKPAVFLRLHGCNLTCSWCDTSYTWNKDHKEFKRGRQRWTVEETLDRIRQEAPESVRRLVITGGEPLLQQEALIALIDLMPEWDVEIETNGTKVPHSDLWAHQINCSPKLTNSNVPADQRLNFLALHQIATLLNSWFKFVVATPEDVDEVEHLFLNIFDVELRERVRRKILLSPEGKSHRRIQSVMRVVTERAKAYDFRLMTRLHVEMWGSERRK